MKATASNTLISIRKSINFKINVLSENTEGCHPYHQRKKIFNIMGDIKLREQPVAIDRITVS